MREQPDRFRVDLRVISSGWLAAVLGARRVDPHVVGLGLKAVMGACTDRDVRGQPLVWNQYRVFLAPEDYESLRPLLVQMRMDLRDVLQEWLDSSQRVTVAPIDLEVLLAEETPPPSGTAIIQVAFFTPPAVVQVVPANATRRADKDESRSASDVVPFPDRQTRRVDEPPPQGMAILVWPGGQAALAPRVRVVLGRPHDGETTAFVSLRGATNAVNRRQAWIIPTPDGAIVGRLGRGNPVQVNGTLIAPGGELPVSGFPIEISLSDGALVLRLHRHGELEGQGGPAGRSQLGA